MTLRQMFEQGEFISAPGVFDPLSARAAGAYGARALYMTGYGVSASLLGAAVSPKQAATKKLLNEGVEQSDVADLEQLNTLVDFPAVWALDEFE